MWRWHLVNSVMPNAGHNAIGHWQRHFQPNHGTLTVATQNVDDLHERGGATDVLHLRFAGRIRCIDCHRAAAFSRAFYTTSPGKTLMTRTADAGGLPTLCDWHPAPSSGVVWVSYPKRPSRLSINYEPQN